MMSTQQLERENASSRRVSSAPRRVASMIVRTLSAAIRSLITASPNRSIFPMMTINNLLKS